VFRQFAILNAEHVKPGGGIGFGGGFRIFVFGYKGNDNQIALGGNGTL
jgi:hypothetical protein